MPGLAVDVLLKIDTVISPPLKQHLYYTPATLNPFYTGLILKQK